MTTLQKLGRVLEAYIATFYDDLGSRLLKLLNPVFMFHNPVFTLHLLKYEYKIHLDNFY